MGTSTVHRSPPSPHWRVVNNLYDNPQVPRARLLAELFRAAASPYVGGLSGAETSRALHRALDSLRQRSGHGPTDALDLARTLITANRIATSNEGGSPFFGDLANRALHATVLALAGESSVSARLVVQTFLGQVVGTCIGHVVSRDVSAHIGKRGIPTAGAALKLSAELKAAAVLLAANPRLREVIDATAEAPDAKWPVLVSRIWQVGVAGTPEPRKTKR
jgi:hypothetical protein